MEREISKVLQRGRRITMGDFSYDNIPQPSMLSSFAGGNGGLDRYQPSELERMMMTLGSNCSKYQSSELEIMMTSGSNHFNFLKELEHQQELMDSQHSMLSYIKNVKEVQALHEENISLKMANSQLSYQLAILLDITPDDAASMVGYSGQDFGSVSSSDLDSLLHGIGKMNLDGGGMNEKGGQSDYESVMENSGPASMMNLGPVEDKGNVVPDRVSLPKSISVRSSGYLKTAQTGGSGGVKANKQKVIVPGGPKLEELDVYNQGMLKTELCNKWQETGACPYGETCQFAHGIKELRPVIRHPRYKTEVCRMVLHGVHCPYGHRCHFRHTLTDDEKLTRSMNIRHLKTLNR